MWSRIFNKQLWVNVAAGFFLSLLLLGFALLAWNAIWSSWQQDKQMRQYFVEVKELVLNRSNRSIQAEELVVDINRIWSGKPSPLDKAVSIRVIALKLDRKLNAPKNLSGDPRNYIGLAKDSKHTYIIIWDSQGKVRHKRKL